MLTGTAGDDMFVANLAGNVNTFNSGDTLNGGAGNDTLHATIINPTVAQTLTTSGIEHVKIQAQNISTDTTDNNTSMTKEVQVDAARMAGVNVWENNNSRADLVIEDVRIADNQITKDITIVMRETDPGHVDFGLYFDQNSLRNSTASTSQINLQVMDTRSVDSGTAPLLNSPYGGFRFTATDANGVATVVTLQSQAIDDAQTYAQLQAAFQAAADAQFGAGVATVTIGSNFTVTDTTSGRAVTGQEIVIKANGAFTFTTPAGSGWIANGVVPANSGLHTNFNQNSTSSTDLVTSKIILDDVGRGSTGGDLVVGGLSVGDTSTSLGVQRFEITVEDNSKLQTINSTNNTLKEVTIVNGTTTRLNDAYTTTVKNAGNLTVNGKVAGLENVGQINEPLPGSGNQHNAFGFSDVRLIDGSAMTGMLAFTSEVTDKAVTKYMNTKDAAPALGAADNVAFVYSGGSNNDTMSVVLDNANLAAAGTTTREDFSFTFNGNAGNDTITTLIEDGVAAGTEAWYVNSKINANLSINGGDGNDTIHNRAGGDWVINAGAGNDTVYVDNSGEQNLTVGTVAGAGDRATFVFNTADQTTADAAERQLGDLVSSANDVHNLYKATVTVTYKGLTATATIPSNATTYKASDLEINQAIKLAINSNAVLSKLIVATDGPANTLIVTSLIDGEHVLGDLDLDFAAPTAAQLSAQEVAAIDAAWNLPGTATAADVVTAVGAAITTLTGSNAYATAFANDDAAGAGDITGVASTNVNDSTIELGTGDDVLVLSTDVTGATANETSTNTVKYTAAFGNDVIVNFTAGALAAGDDVLDFTAIGGATGANFNNAVGVAGAVTTAGTVADKTVVIDDLVAGTGTVAGTDNNSAALVANLFQDSGTATAKTYVYVAVNAANVGTVYSVVDAVGGTAGATTTAGGSNVTATLLGTIDLADTAWSTVAATNIA